MPKIAVEYPFDWQTQGGVLNAGTPLITTTPYCYEAFDAVYGSELDGTRGTKTELLEFAAFTWSSKAVQKSKDFEQMTAAEQAPDFPKLNRFRETMRARSSVKAVHDLGMLS